MMEMTRTKNNRLKIGKSLSVARTILAILGDIGEGTVKSFFPHPYYHLFCQHNRYSKDHGAFSANVAKLEKRGLVFRKKEKGKNIFYLTSKGERKAFFAKADMEMISAKPSRNKWDGKWRFIFFDIPESKRYYRDYLRKLIKFIGFKEFQKSIWVYPFQIPSFLSDILWEENIRPYTRFIVVDDMDYDKDLRKIFFS